MTGKKLENRSVNENSRFLARVVHLGVTANAFRRHGLPCVLSLVVALITMFAADSAMAVEEAAELVERLQDEPRMPVLFPVSPYFQRNAEHRWV